MKNHLDRFLPLLELLSFSDRKKIRRSALGIGQEGRMTWDKSDVGVLLEYLPADASITYASTELIHQLVRIAKAYRNKSAKELRESGEEVQKTQSLRDTAMEHLLFSFDDIIEGSDEMAQPWGLPIHGQTPSLIYTRGRQLVVKMRVLDGEKTKAKLRDCFTAFDELVVSDAIIGEETWCFVGSQTVHDIHFAIHASTEILTIGLVFDRKQESASLNNLLEIASQTMDLRQFDEMEKSTSSFAFLNIVQILEQILDAKTDLGKLFNLFYKDALSAPYSDELRAIASAFPSLSFNSFSHSGDDHRDIELWIQSSDTLADLKSIQGKGLAFDSQAKLASLSVAFKLGQSLHILRKWCKPIVQTPYSSASLGFINEVAAQILSVSGLLNSAAFSFIKSISGLGLFLNAYNDKDEALELRATGYVLGSRLSDAISILKALLDFDLPQFKKIKHQNDVVSTLDFSQMAGIPLIVQTKFSKKGLVMLVNEDSLFSIDPAKTEESHTFFECSIDYDCLHEIVEELEGGFRSSLSLSLGEHGLKLRNSGTFDA